MENRFSLKLDHRDNLTEIIVCEAFALHIRALPLNYDEFLPADNALVLIGKTMKFTQSGELIPEETVSYAFEIVPSDQPCAKLWNMALFYEAIDYYYKHHLKIEPDGFEKNLPNELWWKFEAQPSPENDVYECLNRLNETA